MSDRIVNMPLVIGDLSCKRLLYPTFHLTWSFSQQQKKQIKFGGGNFIYVFVEFVLEIIIKVPKFIMSFTIFSKDAKLGFSVGAHSVST